MDRGAWWATVYGVTKELDMTENTLMLVSHECMFLGSLSRHNKDLERWTLKPSVCCSSWILDKPCYSS